MFQKWLNELSQEEDFLIWTFASGCIEINNEPNNWIIFFNKAITIRDQKIPKGKTYSSYIWFDEQIPGLRFATSNCLKNSLPFGRSVELVESPQKIIESWQSESNYIPWEELQDCEFEDETNRSENKIPPLKVWAIEHIKK